MGSSIMAENTVSATPNPLITVFVLNWNRRDDLLEALKSVRKQTYQPIEMLVVDNGSTDGSAEAVEREFPEARVVRLDKNYGCPGGRNRGIVQARGEFIFFLDNDGLLHEQAVEIAYKTISQDNRIAIVSAKTIYYKTGEDRFLFGHGKDMVNEHFYTASFSGGASLHRASIYKEIGVYPDNYMYGGEETNMAMRLIDRGYLIFYEPQVIMYHKMLDSARDRRREFLSRCSNALATAWELYPVELAVWYTIRSLAVQSWRALRSKALLMWISDTPRRIKRSLQAAFVDRRPISRRTMITLHKYDRNVIRKPEDINRISMSYPQFFLRFILGR